LVIHTSRWPTEFQNSFRNDLKAALKQARAAYNTGRPERAWVFCFAKERTVDDLEVEVTLQAGVDVLVRAMPKLPWSFRSTHQFVTPSRQPRPSQLQRHLTEIQAQPDATCHTDLPADSPSDETSAVIEAAAPEPELSVEEGGFELAGAGSQVDLVVEKGEFAAIIDESGLGEESPPEIDIVEETSLHADSFGAHASDKPSIRSGSNDKPNDSVLIFAEN